MPTQHAYTLEPGHPTPGSPNLLRPPIASHQGIGILTDFPSATRFRLTLGADSPCADERCAGNLGLSATALFTLFIATHVSIRSSDGSSSGSPSPSQPYGTLSYRTRNPLSTLEPQLDFDANAVASAAAKPLNIAHTPVRGQPRPSVHARTYSGGLRAPLASAHGLAPLHLPRGTTRPVSYYAFFKGWLLLSQLPGCLCLPTSFPT